MKLYHQIDEAINIKNPVVTTGTFDGVHIGHKTILKRIQDLARNIDGESVLITFDPHPRKVLYPESAGKHLKLINSQKEKIESLRQTGLDNLIIVNFTKEFSKISSIDFIRKILVEKLHIKGVVIGFNHHFGYNREGDYEYLSELGKYYNFRVEEIPEQDIHNESVSSTKIRKALQDGRIQRANAYLDHLYFIIGSIRKGSLLCSKMDIPTYKLIIEDDEKLIPPEGVYAINLESDGHLHKGMLNIVNNSENNLSSRSDSFMEIQLFDSTDLIGKEVRVFFHKRIRDRYTFKDTEQMKRQLKKDQNEILDLIY